MENTTYEALAKAVLTEGAARVESLLDTLYRGGGRCDAVLDEAISVILAAAVIFSSVSILAAERYNCPFSIRAVRLHPTSSEV